MKKANFRASLKLIFTLASVLLVVLLLGSVAFAWFTFSNVGHYSAFDIKVGQQDFLVDYYVYDYDVKTQTEQVDEYKFLDNGSKENRPLIDLSANTLASLPQYDTVFKARNKYASIIIRFALKNPVDAAGDPVDSLPREGNLTLSLVRDTEIEKVTGTHYCSEVYRFSVFTDSQAISYINEVTDGNYLSFYNYLNETKTLSGSTKAGLYEILEEETNLDNVSGIDTKCFIDGSNYYTSLDYEISFTEDDWDGDYLNFYMYVSFSSTLIADLNFNGLSTGSIENLDIILPNDLDYILIYYLKE